MDTKKLIKAIQLIIKEEVKKEVAKKEKALRKSILKELKESQPKVVERDPLDVEHIFETNQQPSQQPKIVTQGGNEPWRVQRPTAASSFRQLQGPCNVYLWVV